MNQGGACFTLMYSVLNRDTGRRASASLLQIRWVQQERAERLCHLVGLVHIVVVQRAEEMLQTRHVVVIYGVDDGLHHKGVFLVLNRRETRLKTFNPLLLT